MKTNNHHENNIDHHDNHDHASHEDHTDHHQAMMEDFKKRFYFSLILTLPIFLLSPMVQSWLGIDFTFPGASFLLLALSSLVFFYGGWPFLKGLVEELRDKNPGMMTLIALAISVSYFYSLAVVFGLEGDDFFWELASLIDVMLIGHYIEMKATISAGDALEGLKQLLPDTASLVKGEEVIEVPTDQLRPGDLIQIRPGEKIPADGRILKGSSQVNEAMISGEALPVPKEVGDSLVGGSINEDGYMEIEIQATGEDAYLSKVIRLVNQAQLSRSRTQNLADRSAFYLTILALVSGILSFVVWYSIKGELSFAITRMATVMVIACPHALGLAMPLVVARFMGEGARNGLLIKNKTAFEDARKVDMIVFDKTGTLTEGVFGLEEIRLYSEIEENQALTLAASLEALSEHPLAQGIIREAKRRGLELKGVSSFENIRGQGIRGQVDGHLVQVVSPGYLEKEGIKPDYDDVGFISRVYLLRDKELLASFSLLDRIREGSKGLIEELKKKEVKTWMLTGDNRASAEHVSEILGLDGYESQVLPHEKEEKIKELAQDYHVAMVGDGVNDAPALARADLGIAIGSGTDVAADTADIILVNSNPEDIVKLLDFGRKSYRKMVENLFWATAYNLVAIPLAAGVLYNQGIAISPALGAMLMSLSTVVVAINARFLRLGW